MTTASAPGPIRADGRKIHPSYLFEVKAPTESKGAVGLLQAAADDAGRGGLPAAGRGRLPAGPQLDRKAGITEAGGRHGLPDMQHGTQTD